LFGHAKAPKLSPQYLRKEIPEVIGVLTIIFGVLTSAVIFYVTSSMVLAQKQLVAATRLASYLSYWQSWILEIGLFPLYHEGMKWNKEVREILRKGGTAKDVLKLEEEKKKFISELKQDIAHGDADKQAQGENEFDKEKLIEAVQKLPKETLPSILEWAKTARQNLIEGKTFISDEEATSLGLAFTHNSIQLKMHLLDVIDAGSWLIVSLVSAPAEFNIESLVDQIAKMLWKGILISRNIDTLSDSARALSSKSVLSLTLRNIRNGSRLTKR
jgi:hypothetical protein